MYFDKCDCTNVREGRKNMGRKREVRKTTGKNADDSILYVKMLACSSTTSNTVLRTELGM